MSTDNLEVMSALQFGEELRRAGRFNFRPAAANPLQEAVQRIKDNPSFSQSRLLRRVLTALAHERGEFRRTEASALDAATLGIVIELLDAARAGTISREDWIEAVNAADAAEA